MPSPPTANFDRIARPYRWLEYASFGTMLERCRFFRIPSLTSRSSALVYGDGDGRFVARLLASNLSLRADAIDQSPAMLRLLESRVTAIGARNRVNLHQSDALAFQPTGRYDLIATHFFLDCLTNAQVQTLAERIRPCLTDNSSWVISEFAIPTGLASLPAKTIIAALYVAFRLITGLRIRTLPDHPTTLAHAGFVLEHRKTFLSGLLVSELWLPTKQP